MRLMPLPKDIEIISFIKMHSMNNLVSTCACEINAGTSVAIQHFMLMKSWKNKTNQVSNLKTPSATLHELDLQKIVKNLEKTSSERMSRMATKFPKL